MVNYLFNNTPLMFLIQSFWRDEAFSYLLAKKNIQEIIFLTAQDYNPPLYYLILHFWIKIFGSSEIAIRSLSLIFFWATIYIFYLFLVKVLKIKSTLFTISYLLLVTLNPLLLYFAFEARMYTMFAFFSSLSFYAFYQKKSKLYIISSILGFYTHYFMIFVFFSQIFYFFIFEKKKNIFSKKQIFSFVIVFLTFLPWFFLIFFQQNYLSQSFWIKKPPPSFLISLLAVIYTGYEYEFKFFDQTILKLSLFFLLLLIIGFIKNHQKKIFYFFLLWAIITPIFIGIVSFFKPLLLPRYLIFTTFGLLILIIFITEQLPRPFRLVIFLLLFLITIHYNMLQVKERKKANLRRIIREIKFLAGKDDSLYVTNVLDFHTASYYFDEKRTFIYGKTYEEVPNYVGKVLIPKEKFINKLPIYPNKAFILTSENNYEIQSTL